MSRIILPEFSERVQAKAWRRESVYERVAGIAARLGVQPNQTKPGCSVWVATSAGPFDLMEVVEALLDRMDEIAGREKA